VKKQMKKIIAIILLTLVSSSALIAANHQETFIGTGNSRDSAEQDARSQASPHGGISSVVSIDTKKTAPNMWICVLKAMVSN
jgi:uncharacterized protein YdeI (BOF family)